MIRCVLLMLLLAGPAAAHSPYFGASAPCTDGTVLRVLYGDGLFGPDPKALVVTDADGRLRAFQNVGQSTVLINRAGCAGVDFERGRVWRPERAAFSDGPVILGDWDMTAAVRWQFEPSVARDAFGFRHYAPTAAEWVRAATVILVNPVANILGLALGSLSGLAFAPIGSGRRGLIGRLISWVLRLAVLAFWAVVFWLIFGGFLAAISEMGPVFLGAAFGLVVSVGVFWMRSGAIPK